MSLLKFNIRRYAETFFILLMAIPIQFRIIEFRDVFFPHGFLRDPRRAPVKNNSVREVRSCPASFVVAPRFFFALLEEAFQPGGAIFGPDAVLAPRHAEELVERER